MAAPARAAGLLVAACAAAAIAAVSGPAVPRRPAPMPNLLPLLDRGQDISDWIDHARAHMSGTCGTPIGQAVFALVLIGPPVVPHMIELLESDESEMHSFAVEVLSALGHSEQVATWCEQRPNLWSCEGPDSFGDEAHTSPPSGVLTGHIWREGLRRPIVLSTRATDPLELLLCVDMVCERSRWVTTNGSRVSAQFGGHIFVAKRGNDSMAGTFGGEHLQLSRRGDGLMVVRLDRD